MTGNCLNGSKMDWNHTPYSSKFLKFSKTWLKKFISKSQKNVLIGWRGGELTQHYLCGFGHWFSPLHIKYTVTRSMHDTYELHSRVHGMWVDSCSRSLGLRMTLHLDNQKNSSNFETTVVASSRCYCLDIPPLWPCTLLHTSTLHISPLSLCRWAVHLHMRWEKEANCSSIWK